MIGTNLPRRSSYHDTTMKNIHSFLFPVGVSFLIVSVNSSKAAEYMVVMGPGSSTFAFTPQILAINEGDTVTWTNGAPFPHTTTSGTVSSDLTTATPNNLWDSSDLAANGTFSITFSNYATNTYPYYCSLHYSIGMVGSLTITNASPQPSPVLKDAVHAAGQFQFEITGLIGQNYEIQSSPDLLAWTPISTNLATSASFNVTDPSATNTPAGFYRVLEVQ